MPKEAPQTPDTETTKSTPSREGWFRRNRGKLALVLGIALGANAGSIGRGALMGMSCANGAISWAIDKVHPPETKASLSEKDNPKPDRLMEEIEGMPSVCDLREGAAFADAPKINAYCNEESDSECRCPMAASEHAWNKKKEISQSAAYDYFNCMRNFPEGSKSDPSCNIGFNVWPGIEVPKDQYTRLENISDSYASLLQEFDPTAYRFLKGLVYVGGEMDADENNMGTTAGPYTLVCENFVKNDEGSYYLVDVNGGFDGIDMDQAVIEGNRELMKEFIGTSAVLAHEIFGHVQFHSDLGRELCNDEALIQGLKSELYAQYTGARMMAHMAQRWPVVHQILKEDTEMYQALRDDLNRLDICEVDIDTLRDEERNMLDGILAIHGKTYMTYLEAQKTGDWRDFKEMIFVGYMSTGQHFSALPYILEYYRKNGHEESYSKLNEAVKEVMDERFPEELLSKE